MGLIVPWHSLPIEEVFHKLESGPNGLSDDDVLIRQRRYGRNTLPVKRPPSIYLIFLFQFLSPLIYVLIVAGVISVIIGDFKDAFFIFFVILLNA
ncbi:MAG: cation-transporting P-type ATPase, partial [bacterium]|nr:cation-transporting P-type ATPase [bacterium]